jgi:hypothetical protein
MHFCCRVTRVTVTPADSFAENTSKEQFVGRAYSLSLVVDSGPKLGSFRSDNEINNTQ